MKPGRQIQYAYKVLKKDILRYQPITPNEVMESVACLAQLGQVLWFDLAAYAVNNLRREAQ